MRAPVEKTCAPPPRDPPAPLRGYGRRSILSSTQELSREALGAIVSKGVLFPEGRTPVSVLTVDDQARFRRVARQVIEATDGFQPASEAASGEEALRLAETCRPDLVLIDVRMPGMHGVETAARMKRSCPAAVVALISTDPDAVGPSELDSCGAADFVLKQEFGPAALHALWAEHGFRRRQRAG